jgi:arsenite-transporting ATPase
MRLVLYTGKGGVGKTTTAAATAVCAAARGRRTLVVSADAAHSLAAVLLGDTSDPSIGPKPVELAPNLVAVEVDARIEMESHWGSIRDYLVSLFRYQGIDEVVAEELALLPGAEELATLLAIESYAESGDYDFIVVDCAPTDTTLRLATLPDVARGALRLLLMIQRAVSSVITPLARSVIPLPLPGPEVFRDVERLLYRRLRQVRRRLLQKTSSVRLVVTPERMVIDEARRAYTDLSLFDIACDAVVMNRLLPEAAVNEEFFREWGRVQEDMREEVVRHFSPLRVLPAPLAQDEVIGLASLAAHGEALFADCEPDAVLSQVPRVRFSRSGEGYLVTLPLPGAGSDELDVTVVEDELVVRVGSRRRALILPRRVAPLPLTAARLEDDVLTVSFGQAAEDA